MLKEKYMRILKECETNNFDNIKEICKKNGCDATSFYRALKKEGIERPKRIFFTSSINDLENVEKMFLSGDSPSKISTLTGMDYRTVLRYLKHKNIDYLPKEPQHFNCNYDYFNNIDTEEKAYWYGFIMADGSIRAKTAQKINYNLTIELSAIDVQHLEKFKKCIKSNHCIKKRNNQKNCCISINGKSLVKSLIELGCVENKTDNGYVNFSKMNKDMYRHFVRGFFDGDGFMDKTNNCSRYRIILTLKAKKLIKDLIYILEQNDIKSSIIDEGSYYRIQVSKKKNFFKMLHWMYDDSNIYLDRKYAIYKNRIN